MKTIYRLLKYNRLLKSHRVKYAGLLMADLLNIRHLSVRIDPVLACNLRCSMCYFTDPSWRRENEGSLTEKQIDRIASMLFPKALQLVSDYDVDNLSKKVLRIIMSYTDYVNRTVWFK